MSTIFMNLNLPSVLVTIGPDWANDLNTVLTSIDAHDHSSGKGQRITPAGLNINTDLNISNNRLIGVAGLTCQNLTTQPTNNSSIYVYNDNLWFRDNLGNNIQLTEDGFLYAGAVEADSSIGDVTYLPSQELSLFETYADVAGTTPVNGTGGVPFSTLVSQGTIKVRGNASLKFSKGAANRQGEGFSYDFTIDKADKGHKLYAKFDYVTDGTYANGDLKVYVYDVDTSTLITPEVTDILVYDESNNDAASFYTVWTPSSTTSTNYRFITHVSSTSALAYDLYFSRMVIGPVSDQVAISTYSTNTTLSARDDQFVKVSGNTTLTLPSAIGNYGKIFEIKKMDSTATSVTLDASGSETIDGELTYSLYQQYEMVRLISDNTQWLII